LIDSTQKPSRKRVDFRTSDSASVDVTQAVTEVTGKRIRDLTPLNDVLDPDALDTLVDGGSGTGSSESVKISFEYHGLQVTVTGTGEITLEQQNHPHG
jgi:hypothetical protein